MNTVKKEAVKGFTQFEITSDLLRNLYKFDLTPVTKLVLLELTTHLNESKNGSVVFPSVGYIAEVLGIGLTATKKALNDLIKQGFIIKTKRNNVKGNFNKYLLTCKITGLKNDNTSILLQQGIKMQNSTSERSENELFKQSDSDLFLLRTDNHEQNKQQSVILSKENIPQKYSKTWGGNVYSGDDEILAEYAIKHGAKNVQAYINTLKSTKSAEKIIREHKRKVHNPHIAFKLTDLRRQIREQEKQGGVLAETCELWEVLKAKNKSQH